MGRDFLRRLAGELKKAGGEAVKMGKATVTGQPAFLDDLDRLRRQLAEKRSMVQGLERRRDATDPELYERTRTSYDAEIVALEAQLEGLQGRAQRLKEEKEREALEASVRLDALKDRLTELDGLLQAQAISPEEHKAERGQVESAVQRQERARSAAEAILARLRQEA